MHLSVSAKEPHISAVYCYNAAGFKLRPFIILPGLKNTPSELTLLSGFLQAKNQDG